MRTLSRALPAVLAVAVALVGGTLHGRWTDRWRLAHDLQESVDRIARLPRSIGTWTGEDVPQTEEHRATLLENGFVAWAERAYTDSVTGAQVNILLISGRPGPIATHTPEECYTGSGSTVTSTRPVTIEGPGLPPERFLLSELRRGGGGIRIGARIYWAFWGAGAGRWLAPDNPRVALAPYDAVYKLYVIQAERPGGEVGPPEDDVAYRFLVEALPALRGILPPPAA